MEIEKNSDTLKSMGCNRLKYILINVTLLQKKRNYYILFICTTRLFLQKIVCFVLFTQRHTYTETYKTIQF